ncbi:MAG: hypothetical protein IKI30_06170 [Oxalobacter sp.]|nr:hypothetical protein [Oxalobacter sp.]
MKKALTIIFTILALASCKAGNENKASTVKGLAVGAEKAFKKTSNDSGIPVGAGSAYKKIGIKENK